MFLLPRHGLHSKTPIPPLICPTTDVDCLLPLQSTNSESYVVNLPMYPFISIYHVNNNIYYSSHLKNLYAVYGFALENDLIRKTAVQQRTHLNRQKVKRRRYPLAMARVNGTRKS